MRRDTLTFLLFSLGILPFAGIIFLGYNLPMESDCKADADCGQESACVNGYCALLSRCEVYNPYRTSPYFRYGSSYTPPAYPYRPAYPAPAYNQPYRSPSYNPYSSASVSGNYTPELIQARLRLTLAQSRLRSSQSILRSYSRNYQSYRRLWNRNPLPAYKNLMESSAAQVREYRLRVDQERLAVATAQAQLALAEQKANPTVVATPPAAPGTPTSPATPENPGTPATGGLGLAGSPAPAASVSAGPPQPATAVKAPPAPLPLVKECPLDSYCEPTLNRCVRSAPRTTFFAHFHPGYWSYRAQYQTIIRSGGSYSRYQLASFRSGGLGFGK